MTLDSSSSPLAAQDLVWPNRFASLGPSFLSPTAAQALPEPFWIAVNPEASQALGWDAHWWQSADALAVFSGAALWPGMSSVATAYSGHQFGVWAGQLGDGRALLLGEVQTPQGSQEIQLKGSGRTPYSRGGDGRAVLRSSVREFLCSVAMQALGVPTTRALCLVGSQLPVVREAVEPAAIVARVAPSFVRFGHFEHFFSRGEVDELRVLANHVLSAHLPQLQGAANPYLALLDHAIEHSAQLLAQWQAYGFCHGVMNTDNMSILGLTLDYGPFGFLDRFDPAHVCNHSDSQGRYAYGRQAAVAGWNLAALAQALSPLIADSRAAKASLATYGERFALHYLGLMRAKLGLSVIHEEDPLLIDAWLKLLHEQSVDYSLAFRALCEDQSGAAPPPGLEALFLDRQALHAWRDRLHQRLQLEPLEALARQELMRRHNPRIILRQHLAQNAIAAAELGDFSEVHRLMAALEAPFDDDSRWASYAEPPPAWAQHLEVSCSS